MSRADRERLAQTLRMCDDTIARMEQRSDAKLELLLDEVRNLRRETFEQLLALRGEPAVDVTRDGA